MTVYIDSANKKYGRMIMCHMLADTHEELINMVKSIGVDEKHIQYKDTYREHFDICKSKKELALKLGAKSASLHDIGIVLAKKKGTHKTNSI